MAFKLDIKRKSKESIAIGKGKIEKKALITISPQRYGFCFLFVAHHHNRIYRRTDILNRLCSPWHHYVLLSLLSFHHEDFNVDPLAYAHAEARLGSVVIAPLRDAITAPNGASFDSSPGVMPGLGRRVLGQEGEGDSRGRRGGRPCV